MSVPDARDGKRTQHGLTPQQLGIGRLFQHTSDAIVVSDESGRILLWNDAAERLFGWTSEEALGQLVEMIVPERLVERHRQGMRRFYQSGKGALIDSRLPVELPAVRKGGAEIMVELTLSQLREGGHYVLAIIRDVTDRAKLRRALEEERNALRAANESLESFAYVVSHDLKEPVRGIAAYLEALQEAPDAPDRDALIERAVDANLRLQRLLGGLLDWSRAVAGPLEREPVALRDVLRDPNCTIQFQHLLEARGARLEVAEDLPVLLATPPLLCQVFGNLVTNAVRHNPEPSPLVRVRAAPRVEELLGVVVEDNGPGFPREVLDRFTRLKNRPSTVRGGFGLAIARRVVERLGGRISIENGPDGRGARVGVWLPGAP